MPQEKELSRIRSVYDARDQDLAHDLTAFDRWAKFERECQFAQCLRSLGIPLCDIRLLEIGAGSGDNILYFLREGLSARNIQAVELSSARVMTLRDRCPGVQAWEGDAAQFPGENGSFDIVFQSMVFTSILSQELRVSLAARMFELVRDGGICLWYDFAFNNPRNADVRGVRVSEIRRLFPQAREITARRVTLMPPLGRRVGNWYWTVTSLLPWLRSHRIAVIRK
jgi:ubiquinone/menaquinone biosynthesis C-methylase UbiE